MAAVGDHECWHRLSPEQTSATLETSCTDGLTSAEAEARLPRFGENRLAVLGFYQEHRAEQTLAALKGMLAASARVRRDGGVQDVDAAELPLGDRANELFMNTVLTRGRAGMLVTGTAEALTGSRATMFHESGLPAAIPDGIATRRSLLRSGAHTSKRSSIITLLQASTKSCTNFSSLSACA